jgi:CheY-specific phosphatase CheX
MVIADMGAIMIDAVHDVFETLIFILPEELPPQETEESRLCGELISSIHIQGDLNGIVSMSCSRKSAELLTRNMLGTEDEQPAEGEVADCAGEIVNIVTGNLKSKALEKGINFTLSIPTVVYGQEVVLAFPEEVHGVRVPFLVEGDEIVFSFFCKGGGAGLLDE